MSTNYPVVVYGASGYTGRLICEHLAEFGIPFVAAGRNAEKVAESLKIVPGIERAQYVIEEVETTTESLEKLFIKYKTRVVCNTVGPFDRYTLIVGEACVKAGVHYLDTSGEQSSVLKLVDAFEDEFIKKDILMIPSTSNMYGVSQIGPMFCLDVPSVNSLRMHLFCDAVPTVASTQTILDAVRHQTYFLKNNELVPYDGIWNGQAATPSGEVLTTSQWGGTLNPIWFSRDSRVRNCKMDVGIYNQELWKKEREIERLYKTSLQWVPEEQLPGILEAMAAGITPGTPPREERHVHRAVDVCYGVGNNVAVKSTLHTTGGYYTTGLLQAYSAARLARGRKPNLSGWHSPAAVWGHKELLGILESWGYAAFKIERLSEPAITKELNF